VRFCSFLQLTGSTGTAISEAYAGAGTITVTNCVIFGFSVNIENDTAFNASDYNATDLSAFDYGTHNLTSLTAADQIESTSGTTPDLRAKSTGSLGGAGIAISGITTDIVGQTRADPPYIGCWEVPAVGGSFQAAWARGSNRIIMGGIG